MGEHMKDFIFYLKQTSGQNSTIKPILRRSLAFDPGTYVPAFAFVERFVGPTSSSWYRSSLYLLAGLWAQKDDTADDDPVAVPIALGALDRQKRDRFGEGNFETLSSTERRFINLLDSDEDQIAYRLRQMISLLEDKPLDWESLGKDIVYWNHPSRRVQKAWARQYYQQLQPRKIENQ
jgi:CRISPR system Cascade subunit CasB